MSFVVAPAICRRSFLVGAASASVAASLPSAAGTARSARELRLVAKPARWPIVGKSHQDSDVWCYDGRVPGPEIRVRQGEPVRITIENKLEQGTPVHLHRIKFPVSIDRGPGLTQ